MTRSWFFTPELLGAQESWRLATWCVEHGANELSVRVLCAEGEGSRADRFEDALVNRQLASDLRRIAFAPDDEPARVVRLWQLDDEALASVRAFMPEGLFTHRIDPHGWLEDLILFRDGQLMLAVITHQREGIARVTAKELRELERIGFDFAESATSIRY